MTARNGSALWHGNLERGSGTITVGEGVFEGPYSYESRFGEGEGTNPEQLIAAALAGCFTMAIWRMRSAARYRTTMRCARAPSAATVGDPARTQAKPGSTTWARCMEPTRKGAEMK